MLDQLSDDGYAVELADGWLLPWDSVFRASAAPGYEALTALLQLPPPSRLEIVLRSKGALTDSGFEISVGGWRDEFGRLADVELIGPVIARDGAETIMRPEQWKLYSEVLQFARRPQHQRVDPVHRLAWGRIRRLAAGAHAQLDDFLYRAVVLTPEKLKIGLRKSEYVADDSVVEVEPSFEGAPKGWLDAFDRIRTVPDRYDIPTDDGLVQVLIVPQVRTVLEEIKRMPARRVAGARAQAFLVNPYATLGQAAKDVIDEAEFDQAREEAGIRFERFVPLIERDSGGHPTRIGLLIESSDSSGPASSETRWMADSEPDEFVTRLKRAVARNHQLVSWQGFDFEMPGDIQDQIRTLETAIEALRRPRLLVEYSQIHDLKGYSSRVERIGVERPYYSPYIARKDDDKGWFPENIVPVLTFQQAEGAELAQIPITREAIDELRSAAGDARREGRSSLELPWLPRPIPLSEADTIVATFADVFSDVERGVFNPPSAARDDRIAKAKKGLVVRPNIQSLDYEERRRHALTSVGVTPELPKGLRPDVVLLPHQLEGLAWLQHLVGLEGEYESRGAVLADDMGLGKTLQLLALMSWLVERDPKVDPMLVVAPVALLENWEEEAAKFLVPGSLKLLIAHGENLRRSRVPQEQIDERLRTEDGLVKFLRPGWVGNANVVLTTFETLRDFEFSFASQRWSLMVCDEAQRIKNPSAMVTRAAKKQNVRFKVACTGTPVENTLADLWCLFDFVQPGLLGALNEFGRRYRRPIEAKTEQERARVDELRERIAPQLLRRTKAEVAPNLPNKFVNTESRELRLSDVQRNLYAAAIDDFKRRGEPGSLSPFKNHLGLLQYLRLVCTDPQRHGVGVFIPEPLEAYRKKAPKLDWLIRQLKDIKRKDEKVIVFCELRQIQRLLQHYINEGFGYRADIINGDTSPTSSQTDSRQKRIAAFQSRPGFGAIILSPLAVGFGLNIQAANHVIHYTRTWNPAKEDQATDRAYRLGQTKDVYVYYPVVTAPDFVTFDVKLDELLEKKRSLAGDMLNGSGDVGPSEFDIAEIVPKGARNALDERVSLEVAVRMNWQYFEGLIVALWSKLGFTCYPTPGSRDNGIDVVALKDFRGELIQVKTSQTGGRPLGWDAVKEVVGGTAFYQRKHQGIDFAKVCVTNHFFNTQAKENAMLNAVRLVEQPELKNLLERYPTTITEVERALYTDWDSAA